MTVIVSAAVFLGELPTSFLDKGVGGPQGPLSSPLEPITRIEAGQPLASVAYYTAHTRRQIHNPSSV